MHGSRSLTKLSSSDNGVSLGACGRSHSNLSLGHAPSMTSVIEEPRQSTSITNVSDIYEHDPLADASYIRANFTYIPRSPRELSIKTGDVFHIHNEDTHAEEEYQIQIEQHRRNEGKLQARAAELQRKYDSLKKAFAKSEERNKQLVAVTQQWAIECQQKEGLVAVLEAQVKEHTGEIKFHCMTSCTSFA